METSPGTVELKMLIQAHPGADAADLDTLTRRLQTEIKDLDVESVRPAPGGVTPKGAKSGGAAALGGLIISMGPAVVDQLFKTVQQFLSRPNNKGAKVSFQTEGGMLTLETSGPITAADLKALIREVKRPGRKA